MSGRVLGIEIGNSTIKLIETTKKAANLSVERFALLETPRDSLFNGTIQNADLIYRVIAKEMKLKRYKAKKTVFLVQSSDIIIRNAVVNKRPEKVMRQFLALKPQEYLPVETSQYQIDFKILKEFEEESMTKQELLLVAAPNSMILPMVSLAESLKLTPILISIPSEGLAKAFDADHQMIYGAEGEGMVIDIGGRSTTVTIVANGQALLTRRIEFGLDAVNAVMDHSAAGIESAINEGYKEEYESNMQELIKPQIHYNIVTELERILQFYYSRFESSPIKNIYLTGGGAAIKGIRTYIRDALSIPTCKLNAFSNVIEKPDIGFEHYRSFFVNILGAINGI